LGAEAESYGTLVTPTEKAEKKRRLRRKKIERRPRPRVDEKFKIFSGTANEPLADRFVTSWAAAGQHS